ncbi:2-hydroxyacyl-CoA dehydratase [Dokdonella sp.]|uniref:2-hydroxyacyl-CoA dehydratase n=1 Tax=Dokdonella sp. TaxID=2291710 RepID=UPI001B2D018F|nr:2-hydroxyacyl-CoA dehydratase [Dokdonella sp.]MBO9664957.1 2-hydroxyacyl-CoA dehydratase [Dokdonella sp.]
MKQNTYDFRQFQEELAALDRKGDTQNAPDPTVAKMGAEARLAQAKAEFMALRKRYRLTVAHVIAFFPEEEGVAYLQELIAEQEGKSRRKAKSTSSPAP